MNVEIQEVEDLLIGLILEGKVEGRIDQVGMRLELDSKFVPEHAGALPDSLLFFFSRQSLEKKRYSALNKWTEALEAVHTAVLGKTATGGRPGDPTMMGHDMYQERWG